MKRRVLSLIMAIVLCFTMLPTSALAQEMETPAAGASVEKTAKEVSKATDPTTAPTVAVTTPTVAATTPADTTPTVAVTIPVESSVPATEDGALAAEGEIATQSGEGIEMYSADNAVAKVGDTEYDTVQEILDEMEPVEITLLDDVSEALTVHAATTINMDGHTISSDIETYDSLTLKGGTVTGDITVDISDEGAFTMTAPADAPAAIDGGLNVTDGSCSISGAKIGVKGTLTFGGDDMVITGTEKAVELTSAGSKTFYGSATESGAASTEAVFEDGTYKVGGEVAKKLTNKQEGVTPPAPATLTLDSTEQNATAGETVTFTATYTGSGTLDAYIQKNGLDENPDVTLAKNEDGTYTVSVKIDAETPTRDYTLYVHEVGDTSVQAKATIHVTALTPVAEVNDKQYALLNNAFAAANDGDTVTMLASHVTDWDAVDAGDESTLAVVTKTLTLDLSGKTIDYLMVGNIAYDEETETITASYPGNLTIMESGQGSSGKVIDLDLTKGTLDIQSGQIGDYSGGHLTCNGDSGSVTISGGTVLGLTVGKGATVTVSDGSMHAGSWYNDGALNITGGTFGSVQFYNRAGTIAISGGMFSAIQNFNESSDLIPPMSLLAKGYAFYDRDDGALKDGSKRDYLANVTVKAHTHEIVDGKCACGLVANVSDNNKEYYNTLQAALDAAAGDNSIQWVQLEKDLAENATFNGQGSTVTLKMNGKKLEASSGVPLTVNSGTLIIEGDATINQTGDDTNYIGTPASAIVLNNGKLVFNGELHAQGGRLWANNGGRKPAVLAEGGELEFDTKVFLCGGLTMKGESTLTRGLPVGSEFTAENDETLNQRIDVSEHSAYKLSSLLADGTALEFMSNNTLFQNTSYYKAAGSNVRVVTHEHSYHAVEGRAYWMCDCGVTCIHEKFTNGRCTVCGYACPHTDVDENGVCETCDETMVAKVEVGETTTYASDLAYALNNAADGATITLLMDAQLNMNACIVDADGNNKAVTLNLDGHSITGSRSINIGKQTNYPDPDTISPATLKIIGTGSILTTFALNVFAKGTLDLTGWTGGTINIVSVARNGNTNEEGTLTVGANAGHINKLSFYSWPGTTITSSKLYGGNYGMIDSTCNTSGESVSLAGLLPAGYAFRNEDGTFADATSHSLDNVTISACDHGGTSGFEINSTNTCPYCGAPAVAYTGLLNVEGDPWRNFANLQDALDADRAGSSVVRLLADVSGEYTINGTKDTGLDLNGYSIKGTVHVTGEKGNEETAFSNSKSTGTIQQVVAHENANLAVSGAAAVIEKLTLADGATWENIVSSPRSSGYKVYTNYPDLSSYKWYAPAEVSDTLTALNNVSIERLPITSNTLSFKVNGKSVTSVERGTTVQLCASCNTKDADVTFYVGKQEATGTNFFTLSGDKVEYKKINTTWYYVAEYAFNEIGTYEIYFTASKEGYSVTSKLKTLTVTKLDLSKAVITFRNNSNESTYEPFNSTTTAPGFTVTYNGKKLTLGVDYTASGTSSTNGVSTQTLTITAVEGSDYTGKKTAEWKIVPHKAKVKVEDMIRGYDGTTNLPADKISLVSAAGSAGLQAGQALPLDADRGYELIDARYDSADASEAEKTISFTIKLTDTNYTFEDGSTEQTVTLNGAELEDKTFKINQATVTPADEITQLVFNDLERIYEIDLKAFLPELPIGCEYGKILNQGCDFHFTDSTYLDSNNNIFVSNEGILTLPIVSAHTTNVNGQIGTITVPIVSTNYQKFDLTIKVVIGEKIPLDQSGVSVSATDITYGQTLEESTLTATGSMVCPRMHTEIPGTFAWTDGTIKPNAGSCNAEWTFTPAKGYEEYAPATGNVTVKVKPAKLQNVSVKVLGAYYTGEPQRASAIASGQSVDGTTVTFTYSDKEDGNYTQDTPAFTDAGTYTVYYKAEAANHEPAAGTFTVTIDPLPISLSSVSSISKTYDGSADVTVDASKLTFISKTVSLQNIQLPAAALTITAQFTRQQADGNYLSSPEAGDGKALSYAMTLTGDNYVFEKKDFPKTDSGVFATDDTTRFTITKAAAPTNIQTGTLNVINGTMLTYTYDFSQLLPELSGNASFGKVSYGNGNVTGLATGYHVIGTARVNETTGALTLRLESVFSTGQMPPSSKVGTVSVRVYTTNFQTFLLELNLNPIDQIKPVQDGDITATEITYGDALSKSIISGRMKDPNTDAEVTGTFAWNAPDTMLSAGDREDDWTFTPDAPEYAAVTGKTTVKVNPKSIVGAVVTLEDTFVYDGTEKWPQIISVVLDGVTLTGVGRGTDYGFSCNRTSQVGTYYDDFSIGGQGNYTGELKFTWSITPRTVTAPTIEVADGSYVYDGGTEITPTITVKDDLGNIIDPKEYDVSYSNNTDAGIGTVTVTDKEGGNYVLNTASTAFTINKAAAPALTAHQVTQKYSLKTEQAITLPDLKSLGMPDDAQVSDANAFHSGSYSPAGKIEDGWGVDVNTGAITYTLADGAAAGDVITFTLQVRSNNYEDATVTVVLTLTERDAPVLTLPDIITVDYTGAEIPVSAVTGKSAAFDGKDVPGTWSWKAGQEITNATDTGNKTIIFTPDDLVNYHPVEGTVFVSISRVAPDYTAPTAIDGLIYSGSAQTLVNAGSTAHGKLLYSLDKDGTYSETIPTGTDAGEYTVWYKVAGDNNHTDTQPASVTVTVAPKTVTATVTVSGDSLTYTGDPLKPDVIVKDGDTVISPDEYEVSYADNVNAGTATVTVKNKAGGNYTVSGSTTFEIGKAVSGVKTDPGANTGLVYNGGEQTLVTTGTALGGKLKYRLGESGEFTAELPKAANAGTYTVYYMVEGDGNHRDSEVYSLTVTIDKAKVTVTALDKRIYTDDKAPDLSNPAPDKDYTVSGLFGEDALTGDIKLTYVDASGTEITPDTTKVGKTIIRAGGLTAPNDNYTVVFVDGKLTVDERPVYTIKATAGLHGSITPSGNVDVLHGGSQTFTIAANSGYAISNVKIDGVSIGAVKSYTFENVTENHTIEVTFMKANGNPQTGVMVDEVTGEYYVA